MKVLEMLAGAVMGALLCLLFVVMMVEWWVGCGESWVQADGSRVAGECVFIGRLTNIDK